MMKRNRVIKHPKKRESRWTIWFSPLSLVVMFCQGFPGKEKDNITQGLDTSEFYFLVQLPVNHVHTEKAWEGSLCSRQEASLSLWFVSALKRDPLVRLIRADTCGCGRCD